MAEIKTAPATQSDDFNERIFSGIDQLVVQQDICFSPKVLASYSGLPEASIVCRTNDIENVLQSWFENRSEHYSESLNKIEKGKIDLKNFINAVLGDQIVLSLLVSDALEPTVLQKQLQQLRKNTKKVLRSHIEKMKERPKGKVPTVILDELWLSLQRVKRRTVYQESAAIGYYLPWAESQPAQISFPDPKKLERLLIHESGFVFDSCSGQSFTVNHTGYCILTLMREYADPDEMIRQLMEQFGLDLRKIKYDLVDFVSRLKEFLG